MTDQDETTRVLSAGDGMLRMELRMTMEQMSAITTRWIDAQHADLEKLGAERVRQLMDPDGLSRAVDEMVSRMAGKALERRVYELVSEALDALVREQVTQDMVWRQLVAVTAPSDAVEAMTRSVVKELTERLTGDRR